MASASATAQNSPNTKIKRLSNDTPFPAHTDEPPSAERSEEHNADGNAGSTRTSSLIEGGEKKSFIRKLISWSPVLVLENSGSVARDHLASERTWLAYIRTSLAVSSSGVALVQLFTIAANRSSDSSGLSAHIQTFARPLGATMVLIGLGVCLLGLYRYFTIQTSLTTGKFPTARLEVQDRKSVV